MKSVMTYKFSQVPRAEIPRSSFDRSHGYKTTFDSGFLVPFYVDEALPGDTFNYSLTAFARLATPIKPIMDNMFMETFFFSVPVRQIWDNWEKFNGEQANPNSSIDFEVPHIDTAAFTQPYSIEDYMGIPPVTETGIVRSCLPHRAYNHIYNNWFRDQNLIDSVIVETDDGPDTIARYSLLRRRKRPDYFTSCLPWPQKGDPVTVPLGAFAPVIGDTSVENVTDVPFLTDQNSQADHSLSQDGTTTDLSLTSNSITAGILHWGVQTGLVADLAAATGISINDLRQSFQIQKLLERDARGGTRYPEIIKSHFGVTDPQMLVLQRPEFLGGGSTPISINPVAQTTPEDETPDPNSTPQGNLAAYGTVTLRNHGFTKSFTEHCIIIERMSRIGIRARLGPR